MSDMTAQAERETADTAPATGPRCSLPARPTREFATYFLWLLVAPLLYQFSIVRHELCHALGAVLIGILVTRTAVWPSDLPSVGFRAGYVTLGPTTSPSLPLVYLAPYVFSIITFPLFCWLYTFVCWRWEWGRMSFAFLGLYYPISEFILAFGRGLGQGKGDVGVLLRLTPAPAGYAFCAAGCLEVRVHSLSIAGEQLVRSARATAAGPGRCLRLRRTQWRTRVAASVVTP